VSDTLGSCNIPFYRVSRVLCATLRCRASGSESRCERVNLGHRCRSTATGLVRPAGYDDRSGRNACRSVSSDPLLSDGQLELQS